MMDILGISAFYHDSAACLVRDGQIVAAAQEERFTRKKHDARFPKAAVQYCLKQGGVSLDDIRYVVFYDKPMIKFERLVHLCPQGKQRSVSESSGKSISFPFLADTTSALGSA